MKLNNVVLNPPYADHDLSIIQSKPRCARRLAISSLFPVFTCLVTSVHAQSPALDKIDEQSIQPELQRDLDQSRARLEERLDAREVSPEQRAILIEAWLSENTALQKNIEQERQSRASGKPETAAEVAIPHAPIPPDATPLQLDIIEMENEILDFRNYLSQQNLTPEQRASQIESFLSINRQSLAALEKFKNQAAQQVTLSRPATAIRATGSENQARLDQLQSLLQQAESASPEDRAIFIETHKDELRFLQENTHP